MRRKHQTGSNRPGIRVRQRQEGAVENPLNPHYLSSTNLSYIDHVITNAKAKIENAEACYANLWYDLALREAGLAEQGLLQIQSGHPADYAAVLSRSHIVQGTALTAKADMAVAGGDALAGQYYQQAIEHFRKSLHPDRTPEQKAFYDHAIGRYREFLQRTRGPEAAQKFYEAEKTYLLGRDYLTRGKPVEALVYFEQSKSFSPSADTQVYINRGLSR